MADSAISQKQEKYGTNNSRYTSGNVKGKENEPASVKLQFTSKVAVWRLWIYIVAFLLFILWSGFLTSTSERFMALSELKPHTARWWYRNKALAFQYGFDFNPRHGQIQQPKQNRRWRLTARLSSIPLLRKPSRKSRLIVVSHRTRRGITTHFTRQKQVLTLPKRNQRWQEFVLQPSTIVLTYWSCKWKSTATH